MSYMHPSLQYFVLTMVNLLYATVVIFTRSASDYSFLSWQYSLWLLGAIGVMGLYAICWQQVLRVCELTTAYMFKGVSLIFVMFLTWLIFGEEITEYNILGATIIISGIVLYSYE